MNELARIDRALDEMLVRLGEMVLRLSHPDVTRTPEERHALVLSVNQYAACAARSDDPRVHQLRIELEDALRPRLRLVARR
jgi:hypothetical protein